MAATLILFFTACTKQQTEMLKDTGPGRAAFAEPTPAFISSWEPISNWQTQDSGRFSVWIANRGTPQVTNDILQSGAVLVYARNYTNADGVLVNEPTQVPFAVYPEHGHPRPAYHEQWYYMASVGNIRIGYRTDKHQYVQTQAIGPNSGVQFRYIVLPANEMSRLGQTSVSLSRMTYGQLIQLLGVGQ